MYHLEFPDNLKPLMQFLQEKLFSIPATVTGKVGVVYNNFYRMFNVMQKNTQQSEEND